MLEIHAGSVFYDIPVDGHFSDKTRGSALVRLVRPPGRARIFQVAIFLFSIWESGLFNPVGLNPVIRQRYFFLFSIWGIQIVQSGWFNPVIRQPYFGAVKFESSSVRNGISDGLIFPFRNY